MWDTGRERERAIRPKQKDLIIISTIYRILCILNTTILTMPGGDAAFVRFSVCLVFGFCFSFVSLAEDGYIMIMNSFLFFSFFSSISSSLATFFCLFIFHLSTHQLHGYFILHYRFFLYIVVIYTGGNDHGNFYFNDILSFSLSYPLSLSLSLPKRPFFRYFFHSFPKFFTSFYDYFIILYLPKWIWISWEHFLFVLFLSHWLLLLLLLIFGVWLFLFPCLIYSFWNRQHYKNILFLF